MPKNDNGYRLFRLTNGDCLVSKVCRSNEDKFYLERPMKINSIIANDPEDKTGRFKRELVYLTSWVEYTKDNIVSVSKTFVMAISSANSDISMAYDIQKEREDTPSTSDDNYPEGWKQNGFFPDNSIGGDDYGDDDSDEYIVKEMDVSDMSIKDIVNNILEDIINNRAKDDDTIVWDEENIDKTDPEYGSRMDDWSPNIEDYTNEDDDTPFSSEENF
jgi:hypothetical protein